MEKYSIGFKRSAEAELSSLPKNDLHRVIKRIQDLAMNPRPLNSQKLSNSQHYRVRQGDYRIVYLITDNTKTIEIYKIGHRREVYKTR
jgi:mRNA interferase RelE/StbE